MKVSKEKAENQKKLRTDLLEIYEAKHRKNPSYSLRAFALQLGVNKSTLIAFLNANKLLSDPNYDRLQTHNLRLKSEHAEPAEHSEHTDHGDHSESVESTTPPEA